LLIPLDFAANVTAQRQGREIFVALAAIDQQAPLGATSQTIQMPPRWGFPIFCLSRATKIPRPWRSRDANHKIRWEWKLWRHEKSRLHHPACLWVSEETKPALATTARCAVSVLYVARLN
jgi:hypothetical protein